MSVDGANYHVHNALKGSEGVSTFKNHSWKLIQVMMWGKLYLLDFMHFNTPIAAFGVRRGKNVCFYWRVDALIYPRYRADSRIGNCISFLIVYKHPKVTILLSNKDDLRSTVFSCLFDDSQRRHFIYFLFFSSLRSRTGMVRYYIISSCLRRR